MPANEHHDVEGPANPLSSSFPQSTGEREGRKCYARPALLDETIWQIIANTPEEILIETLRLKEFFRLHPEIHWRDRNIILGKWSQLVPFALMVFLGLIPELAQSVSGGYSGINS